MGMMGRWSATIAAFALLMPFKVEADADFYGVVGFSITPQAGDYTSGAPAYSYGPNTVDPSGEVAMLSGPTAANQAMGMWGESTYDGDIFADVSAQWSMLCANLTANPVDVPLSIGISFNLSTDIYSQEPGAYDHADLTLGVYVSGGSFNSTVFATPLNDNASSNNVLGGVIDVPVPANSIEVVGVDFDMMGEATSEVPEPTTATLLLLSFGASTLQILRKRLAVQQARQSQF